MKKDETEYDGIESYLKECLSKDDIKWMPIGIALSVRDQEREKVTVDEHVDRVLEIVSKLK